MAQTHLEQVLKAAGLPDDQIKAVKELPDDAKDFKSETYTAPILTAHETRLKNDPKFYEGLNKENLPKDFLKTLESEQFGRSAALARQYMLKATGLSDEDFKDLGDDGKKIDVFTPAFVKKLSEGKVTDKELQAKLIEANKEVERLKGELPKTEEKFKTDYESKISEFTVKNSVLSTLATAPGLKVQPKYLVAQVLDSLKGKFHLQVNGDSVELMQKEKPTLKALTANNTKELTLAEAINEILEADQLVDKKKVDKGPSGQVDVQGDGKGLKITSNVNDKIKNRMAQDQKAG